MGLWARGQRWRQSRPTVCLKNNHGVCYARRHAAAVPPPAPPPPPAPGVGSPGAAAGAAALRAALLGGGEEEEGGAGGGTELGGLPWGRPCHEDYAALAEESEYAAW